MTRWIPGSHASLAFWSSGLLLQNSVKLYQVEVDLEPSTVSSCFCSCSGESLSLFAGGNATTTCKSPMSKSPIKDSQKGLAGKACPAFKKFQDAHGRLQVVLLQIGNSQPLLPQSSEVPHPARSWVCFANHLRGLASWGWQGKVLLQV